jgi:hypothetical protein
MIHQMRVRFWLVRHMRHAYSNLTGPVWYCSCGSTIKAGRY